MKIFLDSSSIKEIEFFKDIIDGVTTNPSIMKKDGIMGSYRDHIIVIASILGDKPVSVEVISKDPNEMVKQALDMFEWRDNIIVKIPADITGFVAISRIYQTQKNSRTREEMMKWKRINVTAIISPLQALLFEKFGVGYLSVFFNRISDLGFNPFGVLRLMLLGGISPDRIIIGSLRTVRDIRDIVNECHSGFIITVTPDILRKMISNPKTDETISEFLEAASASNLHG